jgi:hypothetical protein
MLAWSYRENSPAGGLVIPKFYLAKRVIDCNPMETKISPELTADLMMQGIDAWPFPF